MTASVPTTEIFVENGLPSFFYTSRATYPINENDLYFDRLPFFYFLRIFSSSPKTTKNRKMKPQILGGYVMLT